MDTRLLSTERTPRLRVELPAERHLVLPLPGPRQQRPATAAARTGDGQAAIRIRTAAYPADARGLADRSQPGPSAVQAGGAPGAYESPSQEADQPAPSPDPGRHHLWPILGHGLRAWPAVQRQEVLRVDGHRQVASAVRSAASRPRTRSWSRSTDDFETSVRT